MRLLLLLPFLLLAAPGAAQEPVPFEFDAAIFEECTASGEDREHCAWKTWRACVVAREPIEDGEIEGCYDAEIAHWRLKLDEAIAEGTARWPNSKAALWDSQKAWEKYVMAQCRLKSGSEDPRAIWNLSCQSDLWVERWWDIHYWATAG